MFLSLGNFLFSHVSLGSEKESEFVYISLIKIECKHTHTNKLFDTIEECSIVEVICNPSFDDNLNEMLINSTSCYVRLTNVGRLLTIYLDEC
jgi:hypothetical protein